MATITQQRNGYSDNTENHHGEDEIVDDDAEENVLEGDEDFYGFHENEDVTSKADEAYIDMLKKIIYKGKNVA